MCQITAVSWTAAAAIVATSMLRGASAQVNMQGATLKNLYTTEAAVYYSNAITHIAAGATSDSQDGGYINFMEITSPLTGARFVLRAADGSVTADSDDKCFLFSEIEEKPSMVTVICARPPHSLTDVKGKVLFCDEIILDVCQGRIPEVLAANGTSTRAALPIA